MPGRVDLVEGISKRKEHTKSVEIFSPVEIQSLLDACSADLAACLGITAFAGVRMEEILRMHWEDVYRRPGFIEMEAHKAKTARRRSMPLSSNLALWLARAGKKTVRPHSKACFFEAVPKAAASAGITWKSNALRHSFISFRLAQTQNKNQVAEEAGNSAAMIDRH